MPARRNTYVVTSLVGRPSSPAQLYALRLHVTGNNGNFRAPRARRPFRSFVGSGITDEAAPPATARLKVHRLPGRGRRHHGDGGGLASTALDFTTLGLLPGMWLKIDSHDDGQWLCDAANNDWVRITGRHGDAIPLDNLPSGWGVDAGTARPSRSTSATTSRTARRRPRSRSSAASSIRPRRPTSSTPAWWSNTYDLTITSKQVVTGTIAFTAWAARRARRARCLDRCEQTGASMAANANVGRVAEGGSTLTSPNWAQSLKFQINNNNRQLEAVDSTSPVGINSGECTVTGTIEPTSAATRC
jgi:hypothetical protein